MDTTIVEAKVGKTVVKLIRRDDEQSDIRYATRVEEEGELRGSPRGYTTFEKAMKVFMSGLHERATEFEKYRV